MAAVAHIRPTAQREATAGEMPAPDLVLPSFDARALARRAALPALGAAVVAAVLLAGGGPAAAFADALSRAFEADPRWVGAAVAFELASFGGYVALLWLVGSRASSRIGIRESAQVTLAGAAVTRLLPTAGAGGAALTLWALRRAGLGARAAARTLLAFLVVLYAVFLLSIAVAGGLLAFGIAPNSGPLALSAVPAAGAMLAMALAVALWLRARAGLPVAPLRGRVARKLAAGADVFGEAMVDAWALVRTADPRLLGAAGWWALDAAVLWAMLHAFGVPPSIVVFVLAYFVGQVANTVPVPGAASGGLIGVMLAFGVAADLAIVSILAYRAVAIWLPAPIGLAALGGLRRTVASWKDEAELAEVVDLPARRTDSDRPPTGPIRVQPALRPAA